MFTNGSSFPAGFPFSGSVLTYNSYFCAVLTLLLTLHPSCSITSSKHSSSHGHPAWRAKHNTSFYTTHFFKVLLSIAPGEEINLIFLPVCFVSLFAWYLGIPLYMRCTFSSSFPYPYWPYWLIIWYKLFQSFFYKGQATALRATRSLWGLSHFCIKDVPLPGKTGSRAD